MHFSTPFRIWWPVLAVTVLIAATSAFLFGCSHGVSSGTPPDTTHRSPDTTVTSVPDSVLYSFCVMGCNRVDNSDLDLNGNPSTANLAQLDRTFTDMMQLSPRPDYMFLVGDLVLGKTTDTSLLGTELRGWRAHYETSPIASSGIRLVVVPGNHETNDGTGTVAIEQKWLEVMAPYVIGSNGPTAGGADALPTDQTRLSYSFNFRDSHFVLLNSDPMGAGSTVAVHWVAEDLAQARATTGIKHIFVLDHKPAYDDNGTTSSIPASQSALWSELQQYEVEAMLSAHDHIYRRLEPGGKTWMIIAGNGGSPLENPVGNDRNFGFTLVQVMKSGKVIEKAYAREYGTNYLGPSPAAAFPTTLRDSADITWKN